MRRIINILSKNWLLITIIIFAIFLRFYKLEEFATFLGDQGRDAIIIKRILTREHLPAIGAPTSIGQVYLGPFYYYFIAPWLLLFNFNPLGLAFGVAFLSSVFLLISFFIINKIFDEKTALISLFLLSFSYVLIDLSRFSWNPNLLPFFSLFTLYFFYQAIKTEKKLLFFLAGALLSFSIQLHYLALSLVLPIAIYSLFYLFKNKKNFFSRFTSLFILFLSFTVFSSPLIVFDLRHNFLNSKNFLNLLKDTKGSGGSFITNFLNTFSSLNFYSFNHQFNQLIAIILLSAIFLSFFTYLKKSKDSFFHLHFVFILILLFLSGFSGPRHPHYLGVLYPFYFILISRYLTFLNKNFIEKLAVLAFLVFFFILNSQRYVFLYYKGGNQIKLAEKIAKKILKNINKEKFTITSLPEKYSDSTYRYFLEIWNKKPIEKDSLIKADELFVVCEKQCHPIIGNPQWDIAYFAPNKIANQWSVNNVKIYKLIR